MADASSAGMPSVLRVYSSSLRSSFFLIAVSPACSVWPGSSTRNWSMSIRIVAATGSASSAPMMPNNVAIALSRLTAAIDAEKLPPLVADKDRDESAVSVAHRGLPLINLLTAAAKAGHNVMWK